MTSYVLYPCTTMRLNKECLDLMTFGISDVSIRRKRNFTPFLYQSTPWGAGIAVSLNTTEDDGCVACSEQKIRDRV